METLTKKLNTPYNVDTNLLYCFYSKVQSCRDASSKTPTTSLYTTNTASSKTLQRHFLVGTHFFISSCTVAEVRLESLNLEHLHAVNCLTVWHEFSARPSKISDKTLSHYVMEQNSGSLSLYDTTFRYCQGSKKFPSSSAFFHLRHAHSSAGKAFRHQFRLHSPHCSGV